MKPDAVLDKEASQAYVEETGDDTNPQVTLSAARGLLNYCRDNNIPVRGHTLVWHSQTPDWFFKENYADDGDWVSKDKMIERMENYIKNVMEIIEKEYPTVNFYAWDVVNEAWMEDGKPRAAGAYSKGDGSSAWVQIFGDNSFIEYAFQFARKYAPEGCKLYISDYNEYIPEKTNDIYKMAIKLKEKNLIDGIAMQSYLNTSYPSIEIYKTALKKFIHTGLDIQITELNINGPNPSERAEMYKEIFKLAIENSESISSISMYATRDRLISDQESQLFDINGKPNESFDAVMGISFFNTDEPETPKTEILYGDINNDNDINLSDLTMLSLALVGDAELSSEQKLVADVAYNDSIDIADLALLKQYICKDDVKLGK